MFSTCRISFLTFFFIVHGKSIAEITLSLNKETYSLNALLHWSQTDLCSNLSSVTSHLILLSFIYKMEIINTIYVTGLL